MTGKQNSRSSAVVGDNMESAQRYLLEREHQLRVLTDHLPGHVAYVGANDLRYRFVNQKFETSFGRSRDEIIGKHIKEIIGESNYEYALKYIAEVRAGKSTSYVNVFNLAQGRRWIQVNYAPDFDEQGNVTGIIVLSYDITELKQAEEKVRNSERRFADFINFLPDAAFVIDIERKVVAWNRAIEKLTGIKAQEILGKGNYQYAIPFYGTRRPILIDLALDWNEEIAKTYQYVKKEGDTLVSETRNPPFKPESSLFWNSAKPLYDAQGEVVGAIEVIRDITERMRSEKALQQSERLYRSLFENANDAIFIAQDGIIKFPNPRVSELVGYSAGELAQKPFADIVHPADRDMVLIRHQKRLAGDRDIPGAYSHRVVNKVGDTLLVELSSVQITWEGRPATLNFMRDITRQKKMESQLQQAQRMESIGRLAGGIAHDFNNLLMGIQGSASLLLSDIDDSHPLFERLNNIEKYVNNGSELTKQLLGFARGGKYEVEPTDLNPLIEKSVGIFGRTKKEIQIHKKFQKEIWIVAIDKNQIEQVLLNLYVNAWQAILAGHARGRRIVCSYRKCDPR
jgi:PAS domain S-box-containing protein